MNKKLLLIILILIVIILIIIKSKEHFTDDAINNVVKMINDNNILSKNITISESIKSKDISTDNINISDSLTTKNIQTDNITLNNNHTVNVDMHRIAFAGGVFDSKSTLRYCYKTYDEGDKAFFNLSVKMPSLGSTYLTGISKITYDGIDYVMPPTDKLTINPANVVLFNETDASKGGECKTFTNNYYKTYDHILGLVTNTKDNINYGIVVDQNGKLVFTGDWYVNINNLLLYKKQ